jgi:hypothetical protein
VRSLGVVLEAPRLDDLASVVERVEPVGVQALVAEAAIEALDEGVLRRGAGLDEVQCDAALVGPLVEGVGDELRAVVDHDGRRQAAGSGELVEESGDALTRDRRVDEDAGRDTIELVEDVERAEAAAGGQVVADEVHRPLLARRGRLRRLDARRGDEAPSSTDADGELVLAVEALDALVVVEEALAAQLAIQEPVAVARLLGGHLEHALTRSGGSTRVGS